MNDSKWWWLNLKDVSDTVYIGKHEPVCKTVWESNILSRDWLWTGFGMVIGFIELLQNVTTNNDSLIELNTPKFTYKVFSVCYLFTIRCRVTDPNNVLCFRALVLTGWRLSHKY
jgi:hypothetical protein